MEGDSECNQASIDRLLRDIRERRQQAMRFAALVEQSMHHDADSSSSSDYATGLEESPPESLFEDFTRDFINTYPTPQKNKLDGTVLHGKEGTTWAEASSPGSAFFADNCVEDGVDDVDDDASVGEYNYEDEYEKESEDEYEEDVHEEENEHEKEANISEAEPRGVAVIDWDARRQLWARVAANGKKMDGASDDEEERILAIVHMAERCQLDCADPPKKCAISAQFNAKSNTEADNIQKKPQQQQSHWTEGEWRQWAEYVTAVPKMPRLEQDEMAQRLDAVHELQDGAWQHGYRDTVLDNGKLQRTYATQPVVVQAYPDGNVKRTAGGAVITLYYANGDWSCTVPGRCCYYYYSEERVWHEQHDDGRTAERPCT